MRGHGLHGIGDGENARFEDNLLAFQPFRVTGAVYALVVLEDDVANGPRKVDVLDDLEADFRVRLDNLVLGRRQSSRPVQYLGRDIDLADIVDAGAEGETFEAPVVEA